ncbi:MAG: hypothetical protein Fues2KO_54380 [Fuerstiella sp.]
MEEGSGSVVLEQAEASGYEFEGLDSAVKFSALPLEILEVNQTRMRSRRLLSLRTTFLIDSSRLRIAHECQR